jgi:diguanylate cyclase (GGDEF)-like protein/PAS domain S-box-containing protein
VEVSARELSAAGVALPALRALPGLSTLVFDEELRLVLVAGEELDRYGLVAGELEGQRAGEVFAPERWEVLHPLFLGALHGESNTRELWSARETHCHQLHVAPLADEHGTVCGGVASFTDITQRRHAEEARRHAQERFELLFECAPIGIALVTPDGRWVRVNQALLKISGYTAEELQAKSLQEITHPDDLTLDAEHVQRLLVGEIRDYQLEKRYLHARGHVISALLSMSLARDLQGKPLHFIAQIQDLTERRLTEERLRHLAEHDALTGLYNRRHFEQQLSQQVRRCQRYGEQAALLVIDLDGFMFVNDTHGHRAGDELLKTVARELQLRLRGTDLVARFGGDEFAVLLPGTNGEAAARVGRDLARVIGECAVGEGERRVCVSASFGVAAIEPDTASPESVLIESDRALSDAKDAKHAAHAPRSQPSGAPGFVARGRADAA